MREKINFDRDWRFHREDIKIDFPPTKKAAYDSAKTERMLWGPASREYETDKYPREAWRRVDLPHDYIIEGEINEANNQALGYIPYCNAWYRKTFALTKEDENKRLTLLFEGVATHATVYLNGCLLKRNFCGYTTFEVDITDFVFFDKPNVLAVYVSTDSHESWWYEGGGIYRHVWLCKTELCSIDLWGVYAKPQLAKDDLWRVDTETTLRNDTDRRKLLKIKGAILDSLGNSVASAEASGYVGARDKKTLNYTFNVHSPLLWSPDEANIYTVRTQVYNGNSLIDEYDVKIGFRTVYADPKTGLYINGKHYKIKGLCGHADFGLSGKAVPDNIHRYKVSLMKEMGANGYRTSHYPQAEALMDALDENGFIVMAETRWFDSSDEGKAQLEMLIKRDRNRPSVFFWSLGNEEFHHATETGRRIVKNLLAFAKKLDDTRMIMTAVDRTPSNAAVLEELDIVGVNYNWGAYEAIHKKFPSKPVLSSENCATGTTRGFYQTFDDSSYISAYDHDTHSAFRSREYTWKFIMERKWMLGGYQWIAFEHRGEATWPRICSQSGAIDLFMQKKDAFYQNMSHWTTSPMVHLLPHWNFNGLEGEPIKVFAYTNTQSLELFLNGESQGRREIEKYGHGEWTVPYASGKLEVVAYDEGGNIIARDSKITTGKPKKLMLRLDTPDIKANGQDIAIITCYTVDENGLEVPNATPTVHFYSNSLGYIYSTGSDIADHSPLLLPTRKMRAGRIGVAVKIGDNPGELKIFAESDGLEAAMLSVELTK